MKNEKIFDFYDKNTEEKQPNHNVSKKIEESQNSGKDHESKIEMQKYLTKRHIETSEGTIINNLGDKKISIDEQCAETEKMIPDGIREKDGLSDSIKTMTKDQKY